MSALVKSRPVVVSAPRVRALLDGWVTQARFAVKPQPAGGVSARWGFTVASTTRSSVGKWTCSVLDPHGSRFAERGRERVVFDARCPYGEPGDTLWVRETWRSWAETCRDDHGDDECSPHCNQTYVAYAATPRRGFRPRPDGSAITYLVEGSPLEQNPKLLGPWKPSIHMPRWASRLTLEVTGVRVEQLQDISEADARNEGIERHDATGCIGWWRDYLNPRAACSSPRESFASLWESIHGANSWSVNPWVWVVSFKVVTP